MSNVKLVPDTIETQKAFNRYAREQMKVRILTDVKADMMVCEINGWDKLEYLNELSEMLSDLLNRALFRDATNFVTSRK